MYIHSDMEDYTSTNFELLNPYAMIGRIEVQNVHSNASKHGFNKKEIAKRRKRNKNNKIHRKKRK